MNLTAKYYVGGCKGNTVKVETVDYNGVKKELAFSAASYIECEVGYWRKANAIHKWFVDNVQGHEDDCGTYAVDEGELDKLELACRTVLAAKGTKKEKEVAMKILPPCEGFFFGGTDIDEYYYSDLEDTLEIIERARKAIADGADIYYSSFW